MRVLHRALRDWPGSRDPSAAQAASAGIKQPGVQVPSGWRTTPCRLPPPQFCMNTES